MNSNGVNSIWIDPLFGINWLFIIFLSYFFVIFFSRTYISTSIKSLTMSVFCCKKNFETFFFLFHINVVLFIFDLTECGVNRLLFANVFYFIQASRKKKNQKSCVNYWIFIRGWYIKKNRSFQVCFYVWCLLSCTYTKDLVSHILYTTKIILSKNISATTWIFWWRVINEYASNLSVFFSLTVLAKQFADLAKQSRLIKFTSRRCLGLIKFWTKTALNTEIVFFPICTSYWKPPINSFQ